VSRFHPDYRMQDVGATPLEVMRKAWSIGKKAGLRYIYLGNVVGEPAETLCPGCRSAVIRRRGFWLERNDLRETQCPRCGTRIAGVFRERRAHHASPENRYQATGGR
jgi:pyruvate formate lyase activating enzyme